MDTELVQDLVKDLDIDITNLQESLAPLLQTALSTSASKLPLLDKAKLYVLATYAIESILFSVLRLNGVDAKSHPVFAELARVKEYFAKIQLAEHGPAKRTATLDKNAANRFIQEGLAGNDRYDRERASRTNLHAASTPAKGTHTLFHEDSTEGQSKASETSSRRPESLHKLERKAAKRQRRLEARSAK